MFPGVYGPVGLPYRTLGEAPESRRRQKQSPRANEGTTLCMKKHPQGNNAHYLLWFSHEIWIFTRTVRSVSALGIAFKLYTFRAKKFRVVVTLSA